MHLSCITLDQMETPNTHSSTHDMPLHNTMCQTLFNKMTKGKAMLGAELDVLEALRICKGYCDSSCNSRNKMTKEKFSSSTISYTTHICKCQPDNAIQYQCTHNAKGSIFGAHSKLIRLECKNTSLYNVPRQLGLRTDRSADSPSSARAITF